MKAAIIAVGTELLGSDRTDTNSLLITRLLENYGIPLRRKSVVPDDRDEIGAELLSSLEQHEIVLLTGGLGPTDDDVTKEAVAAALGLTLVENESIRASIEARFASRGMTAPEVNRRQAMVFAGQKMVFNERGTAPGSHLTISFRGSQRHVWIFPGVPNELRGMLEHDLEPWLKELRTDRARYRRIVKITGLPESQVEESLAPFYAAHPGEPLTILCSPGEIEIHLRADGSADDAYDQLVSFEKEIRAIFSDRIFGLDEDLLESVVGRLLSSRGETVATAESCTGGLLASRITDIQGSSAYFLGGVVTYSRDAKLFLLGVDPADIDAAGEVSEPVAREMAIGARRRFGADWGIGITGIAGPTGGTVAKPVGTVHIAVSGKRACRHQKMLFPGDRILVKRLSTQVALDMLRVMMG
ncbi:MAG: competence/damage-inducible protein A [Thermoanaerobaculia bacterium]